MPLVVENKMNKMNEMNEMKEMKKNEMEENGMVEEEVCTISTIEFFKKKKFI